MAVAYDSLRNDLYAELNLEFKEDCSKWGAEVGRDLTIRFKEPDVLFDIGSSDIKVRFAHILDDFFPRYMKIIRKQKFVETIKEIRIEGHTSTIWKGESSALLAYIKNMELSQSRTRSTLLYVIKLVSESTVVSWMQSRLTANGLSSARLIKDEYGNEDYSRSQRVEFRIVTDSDAQIDEILKKSRK